MNVVGVDCVCVCRLNYKDYSMESRLHFRIHAALSSLKSSPTNSPWWRTTSNTSGTWRDKHITSVFCAAVATCRDALSQNISNQSHFSVIYQTIIRVPQTSRSLNTVVRLISQSNAWTISCFNECNVLL